MRTTTGHGYPILQQAPHCGRDVVVLAHLAHNTVTPFVTWIMNAEGECWWGHYHYDLGDAAAEFKERAATAARRWPTPARAFTKADGLEPRQGASIEPGPFTHD